MAHLSRCAKVGLLNLVAHPGRSLMDETKTAEPSQLRFNMFCLGLGG